MTRKRKRGCQNCLFGAIIRYDRGFPDVRCDAFMSKREGLLTFGSICNEYEPNKSMKKYEEKSK